MVDDNLVMRKADVTDRRRVLVWEARRGASVGQRVGKRMDESDQLATVLASNGMLLEQLLAFLEQLRAGDLSSAVGDG